MNISKMPVNQQREMLVRGFLGFCWKKVDAIEADSQNGQDNQEKLDVILTYMELINQHRQVSGLSIAQEEDYEELLDWLKCSIPALDISALQ
jgi:hypothetical protein